MPLVPPLVESTLHAYSMQPACSGFQDSRVEGAGNGMLVPDFLVHFYRLPVCQSRILSSRSSETVTRA
jgi:hypothetical protein